MRPQLRLLPGLLLLGLAPLGHAQSTCAFGTGTGDLFANNVRALLANNGRLFYNPRGTVYNVPAAPPGLPVTPNAIFSSHLWVGGRLNGEVRMAAGHEAGSSELIPGPLDALGQPPADCTPYDRIFRITRADLDALSQGTVTAAVRDWPWQWGAPVVDGDGNVTNYNLAGGDRPELLGSDTHWWVMNAMGPHPRTSSAPFPLEVQVTAFAAAAADAALDDATLYRYRLVWRGTGTLTDAFVGFLTDSDLGGAADDLVGADSALSMVYTYNADDFDEGFGFGEGSGGYGARPPAVGTAFVQTPRVGIYEGAYSAQVHYKSSGQPWGTPAVGAGPQAFLNRLIGLSISGEPIPRCGDARSAQYLSCGTTRFTFTGFPETRSGWTMLTPAPLKTPIVPTDYRMLISAGPFTLQRHEPQDVVIAVTWARGSNNLNSVAHLRQATQRVRDVWRATGFRGLPVFPLMAPQAAPTPLAPADLATGQPSVLTFAWEPVPTASAYTLEIAAPEGLLPLVNTGETRATVTLPDSVATAGRTLTWRVRAVNRAGDGPWSAMQRLRLGGTPITSTSTGFVNFLTTRNAAGPITPLPEYGVLDVNHRGFPRVPGTTNGADPTAGKMQSTNNSVWGIHTADTDASDGGFPFFTSQTLRGGTNTLALRGHAYEMRFSGSSVAWNAFSADRAVYTVPFELWDVGIQSGPEDDVRLVPWMASMGPDATAFDLGLDHPTSGGVDDPQTDAVYWMRPSDTTPGQAGYTRAAAEMQRLGASYTGAGIREEVLAHTVLVCWNCGRAGTGPFLATRPEPGTVFRIETSAAVTSPPVPAAPADGASTNAQPVLYWHEPPGTDRRYVEVARDADFTDIVVRDTASSAGAYNVTAPIVAGWTYYWRVRVHANGAFGADSEWSTTARFTAGVSTSTDHTAMHPAVLTLDVPRPHPVRGTAAVRLGVPASGPLRVRLYDLLGREVARLHDGDKPAGWTTLPLDVSGLTSSLYVLRAEMDGQAVTRSVVVAR